MKNQWEAPLWGTLRIRNPKTLRKWMRNGKYAEKINAGWVFNVGCGRFRTEKCVCSVCRNKKRPRMQEIIDNYEINKSI